MLTIAICFIILGEKGEIEFLLRGWEGGEAGEDGREEKQRDFSGVVFVLFCCVVCCCFCLLSCLL